MPVQVRSMGHDHLTFRNVNRLNFSLEELNTSQQLLDRIDDVGQIEITRRYFLKHRGKQKEIILSDKRDFEIAITPLFKLKCGVYPAKTTADNDDTVLFYNTSFSRAVQARNILQY